jgi:hypothetical protein
MKEECGNCKFYKDKNIIGDSSGYGKCRRFPAQVETNDGRWCGEYVKKEAVS